MKLLGAYAVYTKYTGESMKYINYDEVIFLVPDIEVVCLLCSELSEHTEMLLENHIRVLECHSCGEKYEAPETLRESKCVSKGCERDCLACNDALW